MTTPAQFRLPSHGQTVFRSDVIAESAAPAGIIIGKALPTDMIFVERARNLDLMLYGIQTADNSQVILDLHGVVAIGPRQDDDTMYATYPLRTGVTWTLGNGAAASGSGYVGSEYAFADTVTVGSAGNMGTHLINSLLGGREQHFVGVLSPANDDTPAIFSIVGLGNLIGIIVRFNHIESDISAVNLLKFVWS